MTVHILMGKRYIDQKVIIKIKRQLFTIVILIFQLIYMSIVMNSYAVGRESVIKPLKINKMIICHEILNINIETIIQNHII